jgi:hypothetical protein
MTQVRVLCVVLAGVTLTCGLSRQASAQGGVAGTYISGAEAAEREKLNEAQTETLRLQCEILAETLPQHRPAKDRPAREVADTSQRVAMTEATTHPAAQLQIMAAEILGAFTARRPDWPQYESVMMTYATKLPPGELEIPDYLDVLYFLAQRDELESVAKLSAPQP